MWVTPCGFESRPEHQIPPFQLCLLSSVRFGITSAMDDDIFWLTLCYMAEGGESGIRPRDKWDVVVYAVAAVCVVVAFACALW